MAIISKALRCYVEEDYARSATLAEEAKNLALRSGRVRELLGLALYNSGRFKDAARELLTFKRLTASLEQNHVIADCYRALGRYEKAVEICAEVTPSRVTPELWAEIVIVASSALADQGEFDKALAWLARTELDPREVERHHLRLWYVRADVLEKAGRNKEAKKTWEAILAEDADFFDVAQRLAST
jgi:tetratricopeptide (TPR) repeat protein